ncbi:caax prenyl protease ste24, putative [Entamoeba invadens IP1]|uniref:CAAX prenyl protease n=1 Tax=Entamoeba invadens IP1 TaxID=370355 RepID=A0A0A1TX62_ENTIV|nr:caax prenyl protease ste24, putative [Entamoeba invadens IP1]ELP85847.1 caax prenyl protease ste24, putative [Entamoeba invadens IP1]|eukprot:XP_004185193.1 caax prenyl protease ste24, putative [Entamoeba invadens IP1]
MGIYLSLVIGVIIIGVLFDIFKQYRKHQTYKVKEIPKSIKEIYGDKLTQEEFDASQSYQLDSSRLVFIKIAVKLVFEVTAFLSPLFPSVYNHYKSMPEYLSSILFVLTFNILDTLVDLPFSLYNTFVIREKHKMNNMTLGIYIKDALKSFALSGVLSIIVVTVLYFLAGPSVSVDSLEDQSSVIKHFTLYFWLAIMVIDIVISLIFVPFILPLFYEKKPLEESELKTKITEVMKDVDFNLKDVWMIDASKKMKEGNAFFSGLFGKRDLVLFDNLTTSCNTEEIVAIVLHEVGHCKHRHLYKLLGVQSILIFIVFKIIEIFLFKKTLYKDFGFDRTVYVFGFVVLNTTLSPLMEIISIGLNAVMRKFEFQADRYAVDNGFTCLDSALIKLSIMNKSSLVDDPIVSALENSHPTVEERVKVIRAVEVKKDK